MLTRPRFFSAGYQFAFLTVAVIVEALFQEVTGIALVGGLAAAAFGTALGLVWRSPSETAAEEHAAEAERRAAELERKVAAFDRPERIVEDAKALARRRRYGRVGDEY